MCSDALVTAPPGDDRQARRPPPAPVRIEGHGLVLRAYRDDDVPAVAAAFTDPDVLLWNPPPADRDAAAWCRRRADWSGGGHASWAVADAADDRLLGDVSLHDLDLDGAEAELGYTVLPHARGRGVASRAVGLAAAHALTELGFFRIRLLHAVENVASCTVAQRNGFRLEGTLRQAYRYGDGRRHDEHLHARLATD